MSPVPFAALKPQLMNAASAVGDHSSGAAHKAPHPITKKRAFLKIMDHSFLDALRAPDRPILQVLRGRLGPGRSFLEAARNRGAASAAPHEPDQIQQQEPRAGGGSA